MKKGIFGFSKCLIFGLLLRITKSALLTTAIKYTIPAALRDYPKGYYDINRNDSFETSTKYISTH